MRINVNYCTISFHFISWDILSVTLDLLQDPLLGSRMLGGFECWAEWSVWMGGPGFVGRVCSWGWIAVEIQQLIYQYKVLYYEKKTREKKTREKKFLLFFNQTVQMLFSFGAFPRCFDQLTVGPPLSRGSCLTGSPCLVLRSCSGLQGVGRGS